MKHIMMSSAWEFGTDPFPAYRANLVYGRNKRDREFLPVKDVIPMTQYTVTADLKAGLPTLPDGKFRVIKTKEKGTLLVVPGSDDTNRCLLFVGCAGGFRGGVGVISDGTTGTMIKECSAGNNCRSSTEVIVLLEVGQSVAFHTSGRHTNEVYLYTWNGVEVEKKHFSKSEWDNRNAIAAPPMEDAEVL
jgi:hypothetical protein